jgi:hypothetical protein
MAFEFGTVNPPPRVTTLIDKQCSNLWWIGPVDLDGDGLADVVCESMGAFWKGNGDGSFNYKVFDNPTPSPRSEETLDGSFVFVTGGGSNMRIYFSGPKGFSYQDIDLACCGGLVGYSFGEPGEIVVGWHKIADFDQDGFNDLAFLNANSQLVILYGRDSILEADGSNLHAFKRGNIVVVRWSGTGTLEQKADNAPDWKEVARGAAVYPDFQELIVSPNSTSAFFRLRL